MSTLYCYLKERGLGQGTQAKTTGSCYSGLWSGWDDVSQVKMDVFISTQTHEDCICLVVVWIANTKKEEWPWSPSRDLLCERKGLDLLMVCTWELFSCYSFFQMLTHMFFTCPLYTQIQQLHTQNAKCLAIWSTAIKISQTHLKSTHLSHVANTLPLYYIFGYIIYTQLFKT